MTAGLGVLSDRPTEAVLARPTFPATDDSYVRDSFGQPVAGVRVKVFTARTGGTQVTDLAFVLADGSIGAPITDGVLVSDADGLLPAFAGPDGGPVRLWVPTGRGGSRNLLLADAVSVGGGGTQFSGVLGKTSGTVTGADVLSDTAVAAALDAKAALNDARVVGAAQRAGGNTFTGAQDFGGATVTGINVGGTVVGSPVGLKLSVASAAPISPADGDVWVNPADAATVTTVTGPMWGTTPAPWDPATTYSAGPPAGIVTYQGSTWYCLATNLGVAPGTDAAKWRVLAAAGATGTPGSAAAYDWSPADAGILGWTCDPAYGINTGKAIAAAGVASAVKVKCGVAGSLSTVALYVTTAGATLTNAFVAVYRGTTLLGQSSDQSSAWASTGTKLVAIPGAAAITAGDVLTVLFWCGTAATLPQMAIGGNGLGVNNFGPTWTSTPRLGTTGTGLTTAAPSPLGAITAGSSSWWAAIY